ncbi:hypothetical protein [Brevundimonas sp. FT23042]|uniref:hypothetical protein n=1 Tax=Brevundimonas sp. FT23042 TaxID=3393749 RepID=UPI003B58984E
MTTDWKDEAFARFLENQKRIEARDRQRMAERGEALIELVAADDDEATNSPLFQEGVSGFATALKANDITYSQRIATFDSVDGMGFGLPEFIVVVNSLGPAAIAAIGVAAGAWLEAKRGRSARLKIGDLEVEGRDKEEVEALLKLVKDHQAGDAAVTKAQKTKKT